MSKALATKNVAAVLLGLGLVVAFSFAFATPAKADQLTDLQSQVQTLLAQIATMQGGSSTTTSAPAAFTFTKNLQVGSTGAEVLQLQKFLNSHGAVIASTGAGSPGNETSSFGAKTKAAVIVFQKANGITPASGYWGPLTRAKANALGGGTTSTGGNTTVTPTGAGITVAAAAQPANSLAPKGASRVPFTTFTLTNTSGAAVTVTGIRVQRSGLAQDAAFAGVVLVDQNGLQVGVSRTFDSNHQATVGDTFTLQNGQTVTYTVAGNMAADETAYSGQVAGISVIGVNTTVPVNGSLPITGAQQTVNNTLSVGTVTTNISSLDPNNALKRNIGDTGVKFSGILITAGSAEDLKLYSIRWRMNGSASPSDLANLVTVVGGTSYPTTLSTDGRYVTSVFPGGVLIQKGFNVDAYIKGDIVGGNAAGRVAEFDIDKTSDIYLVGQTYGYGIMPSAGSDSVSTDATHSTKITSSQPWFQGSTVTIQGGTVTTIQNATSVASDNVAVNVPNQKFGGFTTTFAGEPVTVSTMVFNVATSGTATGLLTSVSIVDSNGAVVAGPVDMTADGKLTFSNSITFPVGAKTYTLQGKVPSSFGNGATIQLSTNPSAWTGVTGQTTGNTITIGTASFTMNTQTVRGATLSISANPTPAASSIVAGGQNVLFANIQLDAGQSGEDIRISSLQIKQLGTATTTPLGYLSNCQLWDGTTALNTGSNVVNSITGTANPPASNGQNTFTFDNSLTITKATTKTLALTCNVSSSATNYAGDTYQFGVDSSGWSAKATGVQSSNDLGSNLTVTQSSSGAQTIASAASLAITVDQSSPSYQVVAGGTNGVIVGVLKLHPTNEAVNLQKLGLKLTSGSASDLQGGSSVSIYNGSTLVGTVAFGASTAATSTLNSQLNLPVNQDTLLTIKANLANVGVGQSGVEGDLVKIDAAAYEGTGSSSGAPIKGAASAGVAGVRLFRTYPTFAKVAVPSTALVAGQNDLYRFSVTANANGNVGLNQVTVNLATSTGSAGSGTTTVSGLKVYVYTDAFNTALNNSSITNGLLGTVSYPVNGNNAVSFTAPLQVPAGQTYYFRVVGTVAQVAGSNNSAGTVSTYLAGDTGFPGAMYPTATIAASSTVWSPVATTTNLATTDNDWTNGYLIPGIPTLGTDVVTLTK